MNAYPLRVCVADASAIRCALAAQLAGDCHTINVMARSETLTMIHRDGALFSNLDGRHHAAS